MNTNCKRWIHVTFAIGVLVLAVSASTSATAAPVARAQTLETATAHGTESPVAQAAATARARAGGYATWILNRSGALATILCSAMPVPLRSVLPMGVVVDDGVPF